MSVLSDPSRPARRRCEICNVGIDHRHGLARYCYKHSAELDEKNQERYQARRKVTLRKKQLELINRCYAILTDDPFLECKDAAKKLKTTTDKLRRSLRTHERLSYLGFQKKVHKAEYRKR